MIRKIAIAVLLASEAVVTAYVALVVYLISGWMVNDAAAFRMVTADWIKTGLGRLAYGIGVAGVLAGLLWGMNKVLLPRLGGGREWPSRIAALAFGLVVLVAILGALQFIIERPFL